MRKLYWLIRWSLLTARRRAWIARRDHRNLRFLVYSAVAGLGDVAALVTAIGLVAGLLALGDTGAALMVTLVATVLIAPGPLAHQVAVPLGHHRLAYGLILVDELGRAGADQPARLAAARAAARVGSPPAATAWLAARRPALLDATEVAVQAILAHGRGDRDDARALFASIASFADPAPEAREVAAEWLALDDAERGAWAELVARGARRAYPARGAHRRPAAIKGAATAGGDGEPLWPATSMTFLLEGVGARLLGLADAPSNVGLWVRWLEAPSRRRTWALVGRAIATKATDAVSTDSADQRPPHDAGGSRGPESPAAALASDVDLGATVLTTALRTHARALHAGTLDTVADAAAAWDAAFAPPALAVALAHRATALGVPADAADRALSELDDTIAAELAAVIERHALPLHALQDRAPGSRLLEAVARHARRELLARLELTCDRLGDRARDGRTVDAVDELRTFVALRRTYEDAAAQGGPDLERLAYPHVHLELLTWTVWLWNDRHEHYLSQLVSAWLYERALAVGDAEAIELHGTNGAITIPGR